MMQHRAIQRSSSGPPAPDGEPYSPSDVVDTAKKPTVSVCSSRRLKSFLFLGVFATILYSFLFWMEAGLGTTILEEEVHHHSHAREYYTVVINTFKRPDMLRDAVDHYSKCAKIKYIHVVWSEQDPPSEAVAADYGARTEPQVWINAPPCPIIIITI